MAEPLRLCGNDIATASAGRLKKFTYFSVPRMRKRSNFFISLYMIAAIVQIYAGSALLYHVEQYSKFLLMPMLILYVIFHPVSPWRKKLPLLIALFFCWGGDILLWYGSSPGSLFEGGLACFLCAQVLYLFAFREFSGPGASILRRRPWLALPFIAFGIVYLMLLFPLPSGFALPVILYACALILLVLAAINRHGRTWKYSFDFVLAGALLFMISDSLLAWKAFRGGFVFAQTAVMFTYITAQYCIVNGLLLHIDAPGEKPSASIA